MLFCNRVPHVHNSVLLVALHNAPFCSYRLDPDNGNHPIAGTFRRLDNLSVNSAIMKITNLTTYRAAPLVVPKIDTDEGFFGWGEPVVEGRAHSVATAVDELADY